MTNFPKWELINKNMQEELEFIEREIPTPIFIFTQQDINNL